MPIENRHALTTTLTALEFVTTIESHPMFRYLSMVLVTAITTMATAQVPPTLRQSSGQPDIKRASLDEVTDAEKQRLVQSLVAYNLACEAFTRKDHKTASEQMEICIAVSTEVFGRDYPALAGKYTDYGAMCDAAGQYQRAALLHREALRINQIDLPDDHPLVALNKRALSRSLLKTGLLKQGLSLIDDACKAARICFGPTSAEYSGFLNDRGYAHALCKNFQQAKSDYSEALAIKQRLAQRVSPLSLAAVFSNLGEVQCSLGEYVAARNRLDQALALLTADDEPTRLLKATVLNNLGYLNRCQHNHGAAVDYYHQALAISRQHLPKDHPDIGRCYLNLANVYWLENRIEESVAASLKAREIFANSLGTNHPAYGDVLANISEALLALKDYDAAVPLLRQSLTIRSNAYGSDSYYAARTMLMMGGGLFKLGQTEQALGLYRQALPILESSLNESHSELLSAHDKIALAALVSGDSKVALEHFDVAQKLVRQNAASVLHGLAGDEQLRYRDFLTRHQSHGLGYVVGMPERFTHPRLAMTTATWVINNKSLLNEARSKQVQLQFSASESELRKLKEVRRELSNLALGTPAPGTEQEHRQRLANLLAEEAKSVRLLSNELNLTAQSQWYEVDELISALPKSSACVEFARATPLVFDADGRITQTQRARYCAWIMSPRNGGSVKFVDLGLADDIDRRIAAIRKQIERDGQAMIQRDPAANSGQRVDVGQLTRDLNQQLRELAKLLVDPISPHVEDASDWILSPDGNLWLVPWAALPMNDHATCLIERNSLQFVSSTRDLVSVPKPRSRPLGRSVVVANPDYGPRHDKGTQGVGFFPALPHSEVEARRIGPALAKFSGQEPEVLSQGRASEARIKQIQQPSILVFSTHGFFLSSRTTTHDFEDSISSASLATKAGRDPMQVEPHLSSGLALAGCNLAAKLDGEDGILTGAEVLGLNIRGTELVVLSACDTGVGEIQIGEGVAGLRQAFLQAGARGVIATLWKSLDKESATTMDLFFEQFAGGSPAATALRHAHLQRINDLREIYTEAHPYFWASMTYTGL